MSNVEFDSTHSPVMSRLATFIVLFIFVLVLPAAAQPLPDKIRGYKVHKDKITVNTYDEDSEASVKIGEPNVIDVSLAGVTFELPAEIRALGQSGKVEFLAFHDFKVNGIAVEPEEYRHGFEFRRGENLALPKPARVFLPTGGIVKAAWNEMRESKAEWTVTGRVLVFGRFRRYGFYHKRVVPIDIDLKIKNPLISTIGG